MKEPWYFREFLMDNELITHLNNLLWEYDFTCEDDEYPQRFYIGEALYFRRKTK